MSPTTDARSDEGTDPHEAATASDGDAVAPETDAAIAGTTDGASGGVVRMVRDIAETLLLTFVIFFGVQAFVAQPFQVQQVSMQRSFESGQFVLVDKLSPRWDPVARGDVVVFDPPEEWTIERTPFIKRVIGVAGDTVEVKDGFVLVNGTRLDETYTYTDEFGRPEPTEPESGDTRWEVPTGDLFVMGDHRQASLDSRAFGPVAATNVIGRVSVRYWPITSFGVVESPRPLGDEPVGLISTPLVRGFTILAALGIIFAGGLLLIARRRTAD